MSIKQRVGDNLRRMREGQGLSQEDLAHRSGIHRTYLSGLERGVRNPTITVLERLAKALRVKAGAFLE